MSFEQRCKNVQRRAGKRFKQSTTRKEISNCKYHAKFRADILPLKTDSRFQDILMLWAANFSGESYFCTKRQCKYMWIKSSKLGPVILTLRKTLRWKEASLDCLIGGQVPFFCAWVTENYLLAVGMRCVFTKPTKNRGHLNFFHA